MARKERERRYISEYMVHKWPEGGWQLNVALGPIPDNLVQQYGVKAAAALFRPTRLRVDAVRWSPERYDLIEAKLRNIKDGIGDLLIYQRLAPKTPDLPFYDKQPIHLVLVVPYDVPWIRDITDANNIEYAVFWQDWVKDYVKERQNYFTAEYRAARAEKMRLREILDVD